MSLKRVPNPPPDSSSVHYFQRGADTLCIEPVLGERMIKWAYQRRHMRWFESIVFRWPLLSRMYGWYQDSWLSRFRIRPVIKELKIDVSEFQDAVESFTSFNAFFIRKLKTGCRPFDIRSEALVSPADGRVLTWPKIDGDTVTAIKGVDYTIDELLNQDARRFHDGALVVIRLCPADYHRFHYPCDGTIVENRSIPGYLHSVNPYVLSLSLNVFCENKRSYSLIRSEVFGHFIMMEIGAFGVGSIVYTNSNAEILKMQERGYFKFGGSTIVLVFEKGRVELSADLRENSRTGFETLVKVGETIGMGGDFLTSHVSHDV